MRPAVVRRALLSAAPGPPARPLASLAPRIRPVPSQWTGHRSLRRGFASTSSRHGNSASPDSADSKILQVAEKRVKAYKAAAEGSTDTDTNVEHAKIRRQLRPLAEAWERYRSLLTASLAVRRISPADAQAVREARQHAEDETDPELRSMLLDEQSSLLAQLDHLVTGELPALLLPPSSMNALGVIMSINAGVGGGEAALFVEDLYRMYTRFAEGKGWQAEVITTVETAAGKGGGGLREVTVKYTPAPYASDESGGVWGSMRWESGVHRVQRVPATETMGRVHTSTAAVVILPLYPDTPDAPLVDPKDVKSEVMRSRGAGGQHVNKTESAVRLTHVPTGITVSMQDSRSQHQNRAWAWEVLRARLAERKYQEEVERRRESRRSQVRGADRSEKVRTYNFPQDRVTDHRIGFTLTCIQGVLDGQDLELLIHALDKDHQAKRLEALLEDGEDLED